MQQHDITWTCVIVRTFILLQLIPLVLSCIYLLNGWMPMSVFNRTAMADIVLSANVVKTYKDQEYRTEAQTYTATIKLVQVYKGKKLLRNIPRNQNTPYVYNISNFGDRRMCYADLIEGKSYILFLTTYKQRLSAKYDDIFGAATTYTEDSVQEVLDQVRYSVADWSAWSSCSKSCDGGQQFRGRNCTETDEKCEGVGMEKKPCNTFACAGVHDLLSHIGVYKLPVGVQHVHDRPGAFNITSNARLYSPLADIFPSYLPRQFSILVSLKINQNYSGCIFALSDLTGNQRLAIKLTQREQLQILLVEQMDIFSKEIAAEFLVEWEDTSWHQLSFSVRDDSVDMFFDCDTKMSKELQRPKDSMLASNLMVSLGPYFIRYGNAFEGEIEQLLITDDQTVASQQCSSQYQYVYDETDGPIKDEGNNDIDEIDYETQIDVDKIPSIEEPKEVTSQASTQKTDMLADWTEWSPCSRTCGRGVQVRTKYCGDNVISTCVQAGIESKQYQWCQARPCNVTCQPRCENNGICTSSGTCLCPSGFTGSVCAEQTCNVDCKNGGRCINANTCTCSDGYTGKLCEKAICDPPCRRGGQCALPGYCSCPYGYIPPNCEPICLMPCRNKGKCVSPNTCKCPAGFMGSDCSIAICRRGCFNGGRCVAPNMCTCPRGFIGGRCHKPVCNPACQNKGRCLYPGVCQCQRGFRGALCEKPVCKKPCQNGGICSVNNTCACPEGFRGRWCHKLIKSNDCQTMCVNGGRCKRKQCKCKPGFTGQNCEKRHTGKQKDKKLQYYAVNGNQRRAPRAVLMPPGTLFQLMGPWYANAHSPYDLVLAEPMVSMFGSDDDLSGHAGVYTFKSSDRYFGYAVVNAIHFGSLCCSNENSLPHNIPMHLKK